MTRCGFKVPHLILIISAIVLLPFQGWQPGLEDFSSASLKKKCFSRTQRGHPLWPWLRLGLLLTFDTLAPGFSSICLSPPEKIKICPAVIDSI